jgi:2-amino-4-hydroxy-6-hydroxymethyldihydropteridine diphosphokinase
MYGYGGVIIISLGSNKSGTWGSPREALARAMDEISRSGVQPVAGSMLYRTKPYGSIRQDDFLNAAALIETQIPPCQLLRLFKENESEAGRTAGRRWGPRPLDIDIIDYRGVIRNWKTRRPCLSRRVILPHAEAHKRAFVLRPILDIAPNWHHPVFGVSAAALLKNPAVARAGAILDCIGDRIC